MKKLRVLKDPKSSSGAGALFEVDGDREYARSAAHSTRYVRLTVVAPAAASKKARPSVRVGFVLDRSGSMSGGKIEQARKAILEGIKMLSARDEFAVVTFDDQVDTVIALTDAKRGLEGAEREINQIDARGNTNLCDGYLTGAQEIGKDGDMVQRLILVSDGHANTGVTDARTLARHASELRARGVTTSTLGIGDGFDEKLMSEIATAGGGPAQYAARTEHIRAAIAACVGEALEVTMRNVEVTIRVPGADFELLSAGDSHASRGELKIALGDLGENQERDIVARVRLPRGVEGEQVLLEAELTGAGEAGSVALEQSYSWTFADAKTNDEQARNVPLDRVVAALHAANAREHALALNRKGEYERAIKALTSVADRISLYAGSDPELNRLIVKLREEADQVGRHQDEVFHKVMYFKSHNVKHSRMADFSSKKRIRS